MRARTLQPLLEVAEGPGGRDMKVWHPETCEGLRAGGVWLQGLAPS